MAVGETTNDERPVSALPSVQARLLAFLAILVAGVCGALIGYSFVDLQCTGDCSTPSSLGGLIGAVVAAGGVAIVAVLVLRAMGEWKTIKENRAKEAEAYLEAEGLGPATREPPALLGSPGDESRPPDDEPPPQEGSSSRNPSA
jgi:hypothetical protein